ncbi:MAG: hypothetical protein HZB51_23075 [Chloroflexi bacterium]|nr:hypothetical protein [Chloroflexota bacterium]
MTNKVANKLWSAYYPESYDDFVAEFDARVMGANTPVEFGLWFRSTANRAYMLYFFSQGGYGFGVNFNSDWTDLIEAVKSDAVKSGFEKNHVKVIAQGNQIALFANGQHLDTITDTTSPTGRIGFFVWSKDPNGQVAIDNLTVSKINRPLTLPAGKPQAAKPTPMPTIPAGMGGLMVTNFYGNEINYEIGGKLHKIPANGTQIILLAPGKYPFSADIPAKGRAGGTIEIQAGVYTTQAWADR